MKVRQCFRTVSSLPGGKGSCSNRCSRKSWAVIAARSHRSRSKTSSSMSCSKELKRVRIRKRAWLHEGTVNAVWSWDPHQWGMVGVAGRPRIITWQILQKWRVHSKRRTTTDKNDLLCNPKFTFLSIFLISCCFFFSIIIYGFKALSFAVQWSLAHEANRT